MIIVVFNNFGIFFMSHMAPSYLLALTQKQKEQAGKERKEGREDGKEESEVKVEE